MRVPIAHIAGGEISEGAIDDNIRHAITKLSALHLVATEPYRRRVIAMGEAPERVINTGAIGVYNIAHEPLMPLSELEASIGCAISEGTLLVTMHPATADDGTTSGERMAALLDALDRFEDSKVIITYPNNDAGADDIIALISAYAAKWPGRVVVVPSLGRRRYLSALRHVAAVVGNSSSGIVEVPSAGIPTVDVGMRQRGRIAADSVIHAADDADSIARAIALALDPATRERARSVKNPYFKPDTLDIIVNAVATTPLDSLRVKRFYDGPVG
jgi:UDP-N-acetylglucosamine 2-epimerase (non-hydrolysing)